MKISYTIESIRIKYGIYVEPTFIAIRDFFLSKRKK